MQAATVPIHLAFPGGAPDPQHWIAKFANAAPLRIHDFGDSGSCWSRSGLATAVSAQGRPSLVLCGFWLETTVTFIALPALASGFDVFVLMELIGFTDAMRDRLTAYGLFHEIIAWKLRMFVPTDDSGAGVLGGLMERYPLQRIAEREGA